jgi:hypothetical protein
MILLKMGLRAGVCLAVLLLQGWLGGWLAGLDVLDELVSGSRLLVGAALVLLVPLRVLAWFVVPAWLVSGTCCDLWALWRP